MRTVPCSGARGRGMSAQGVSAARGGCLADTYPCEQNGWQTGVKTLPCRNYVADGN